MSGVFKNLRVVLVSFELECQDPPPLMQQLTSGEGRVDGFRLKNEVLRLENSLVSDLESEAPINRKEVGLGVHVEESVEVW